MNAVPHGPRPGGSRTVSVGPLLRTIGGQGVASLAAFATVLALGRFAGAAELGTYALGASCLFLALSLADTLVATPYTYFAARDRAARRRLAATLGWGVAAVALAAGTALSIAAAFGLRGVAGLWPVLPLAVAACVAREGMRRHLMAVGDTPTLLRLDVASGALQIAGVAALAAAHRLTAASAFVVVGLAAVLPLARAARASGLRAFRHRPVGVGRTLADFAGYGRWLLLGGLCHVASVQAYPWLALAAGGERLAGQFAACAALVNTVSPLLTALTNHFRPVLIATQAVSAPAAFRRYVWRRTAVFVAPALALWVALAALGEPLLAAVYGRAFVAGAPALGWLALGTVAISLGAALQLGLLALRAPVTNLYYHGAALAALVLAVSAAGAPTGVTTLARLYGGVNVGATLLLAALFVVYSRTAAAGAR